MTKNKADDEPIGFIFVDEVSKNMYGNLGIAIGEKYLKKGYASEALFKVIEYIKSDSGKEIEYSHFKENDASRALALKCGFKYYKQGKRI